MGKTYKMEKIGNGSGERRREVYNQKERESSSLINTARRAGIYDYLCTNADFNDDVYVNENDEYHE